jgi:hypothetical protein
MSTVASVAVKKKSLDPQKRVQIARRAGEAVRQRAKAGRITPRPLSVPPRSVSSAASGPATKVRLEVTQVKANKITRELGEDGDEITWGGVAILPDLTTRVLGPFRFQKFTRDGQVSDAVLDLGSFDVAATFPQTFVVASMLVENDGNKGPEQVPDMLEELVTEIKKDVQAALGAGGQDPLGQLQEILQEVQEILDIFTKPTEGLDQIFKMIADMLGKKDEFFPAQVVGVTLASAAAPFPGGAATSAPESRRYRRTAPLQTGDYAVTYQWRTL